MDSMPYARPMSAAARAAALRAKMAGAGVKIRDSPGLSSIGSSSATYLAALDKLTTTTEKWLESLEQLTENALKQQKKLKPEDSASSDERVHKTPLYKLVARKSKAEDVVMKDAPTSHADNDSAKSVGSNDRIRPGTPPNLPTLDRLEKAPAVRRAPVAQEPSTLRNPISPPTLKIEDMDIRSPQDAPKIEASTPEPFPKSELFRPPVTTHTSIASIPPTPHTILTPPVTTPSEIPLIKEPTPIPAPTSAPALLTPPSESSATLASTENTLSVKTESISTSSSKKRRLSSKTILESLMEKKARNPIMYDGVAQKSFYDMVFEMSQQIQSMKREKRIVMFAKDPACGNLLDNLDNLLQKALKTIEFSSFMFLKGKPDIKEIESLKTDLKKSLKDIDEFKQSGWTMANDDDSDSDNDDEDEDEDED